MRNLKSEKGITMITLVVTIIVMVTLIVTVNASMAPTIELKAYNAIKEDIITLSEEVKLYYLNNGVLPVNESKTYILSNYGVPTEDINPNDSGNYYFINTSLLNGVELNKGEGNKKNNYTTDDVYVVNEKSLTVYYLKGAVLDGKKHYTIVDSFEGGSYAEDYYAKVNLPIISVVTMESSGTNKSLAGLGDTITLKILTNYELTTKPTVTINEETVEVNWDGQRGTATYTLTDAILESYNNNQKIPFSISNYVADGRTGETITDVNFGQGVYAVVKPKIGDYVNYTYDTVSSGYSLLAKYSGYDSDQTIVQSSTTLQWRILNIDEENGKIDLVSAAPTDNTVYFKGTLGYNNGVYLLNDMCAVLYSNSSLKITARSINLADMEKHLTTDGFATRNAYIDSGSGTQYGSTQTYTSNKYYPNLYANQLGAGINTENATQPIDMTVPDPYNESSSYYSTPTTETSTYAG
ncbi:MAG: hypothetical protein ACI4VQ_01155, partial [Clostridia bacterium]